MGIKTPSNNKVNFKLFQIMINVSEYETFTINNKPVNEELTDMLNGSIMVCSVDKIVDSGMFQYIELDIITDEILTEELMIDYFKDQLFTFLSSLPNIQIISLDLNY